MRGRTVWEAQLTKEICMTLRLSPVAVLTAVVFTSSPTPGEPPACCPDPSEGNLLAVGTKREALASAAAVQPDKADFSVEGMFVDCCSCRPPCPCEVTEVAPGCVGIGAHQISGGTYAGEDLAGVKIAHAKVVGEWVNLYIEARDEKQRAAVEKFGRAAFAGFGPIGEVKAARIEISGADGRYSVTVDGGEIMKFETEPVLGGDGKTPVMYTNIKNAVNPTVYQGRVVSATYTDGDKRITVGKGRNSHFNPALTSSGKI
jgi:hypothetical protein